MPNRAVQKVLIGCIVVLLSIYIQCGTGNEAIYIWVVKFHETKFVNLKFFLHFFKEIYFWLGASSVRIVGGYLTKISQVPWQVSLKLLPYDMHICGGSVISARWILTAAHCLANVSAQQILVNAGTTDSHANGSIHAAATIAIHPRYNHRLDHDFALIKLKRSLKFDANIRPVELTAITAPDGLKCLVTGWGTISEAAISAQQFLRGTEVLIINQQRCRQAYSKSQITPSMLCAGWLGVGGRDGERN